MIKIFPPKKLDNPKIYPTYLDPFSQVISQPDLKILRRRLYADAIMNEHIIPSISHILGSNATTQLFLEEPELLDEKIIVPFISQPYSSIEGYINGHQDNFERDKEIYSKAGLSINENSYKKQLFLVSQAQGVIDELPIDKLIELKRCLLEEHTKIATTFSPSEGKLLLKEGIFRDYDLNASPFKEDLSKYQEFNKDFISFLQDYLSKEDRIDRALVLRLLEKSQVKEKHRALFLSILNADYYIGGVSQLDCALGTEHPFMNIYKRKFENGIIPMKQSISVGEVKNRVFNKFLDVMNVSTNALDKLDIDGLLSIRKDRATKTFRNQYNELIEQKTRGFPLSNIFEITDIEKEVVEAIESEASKQSSLLGKIENTRKMLFYITISASTLSFAFPYITIPGILGEFAVIDPLLQRYEQNKCNFIVVSDKIRRLSIL